MFRRIVLIVVVFLLLSSGVFAIHQQGDFGLFSVNIVEKSYSTGFEHDGTLLSFSNIQRARDADFGSFAMQLDRVLIGQRTSAWGLGGISGAYQMGSGIGFQDQFVGGNLAQYIGQPTAAQNQGLSISLGESMYKMGGIAGVVGMQHGIATRIQMVVSPDGNGRQSQRVFSMQFGRVTGGQDSDSSMTQDMEISTEQSQNN